MSGLKRWEFASDVDIWLETPVGKPSLQRASSAPFNNKAQIEISRVSYAYQLLGGMVTFSNNKT